MTASKNYEVPNKPLMIYSPGNRNPIKEEGARGGRHHRRSFSFYDRFCLFVCAAKAEAAARAEIEEREKEEAARTKREKKKEKREREKREAEEKAFLKEQRRCREEALAEKKRLASVKDYEYPYT